MQNKRKNIKQRRIGIRFIIFGLLICAITVYFTNKIEPTLSGICDYKAKIYSYDLINEGIDEQLTQNEYSCEDFLEIVTDESGNITAVNTNMTNASNTAICISEAIREKFEADGKMYYDIKIGTLTGLGLLYDKGVSIPLTIEPQGYIETNIISKFTETGINQTTLEIIVQVKMTTTSQLPLYSRATQTVIDTPIAQTMILGKIPNYIGSGVLASSVRE